MNEQNQVMAEIVKPEPLWKAKDVSDFLVCSEANIYRLKDEDGLPFLRIGRLIRFKRLEVIDWVNNRA